LKGSGTDAGADGIRINHDPVRQVRRRRRHIGVTIAQQSCACLRRWHPRQQQVAGERAGWAQRVGTEKPPRDFLARCCATLEEVRGTGHETGNEAAAWRCTLLVLSAMRCSRDNCCHWGLFRDGGLRRVIGRERPPAETLATWCTRRFANTFQSPASRPVSRNLGECAPLLESRMLGCDPPIRCLHKKKAVAKSNASWGASSMDHNRRRFRFSSLAVGTGYPRMR
jgi:hypothetical protein